MCPIMYDTIVVSVYQRRVNMVHIIGISFRNYQYPLGFEYGFLVLVYLHV